MVALKQHVIRHSHGGHQSHAQPVLRHKAHADALFNNLGRRLSQQIFLVKKNRSLFCLHQPGNGLAKLLLSASRNTGHAEDLPFSNIKGNVVDCRSAVRLVYRQIHHLEHRLMVFHTGPVNLKADGPSHHQLR